MNLDLPLVTVLMPVYNSKTYLDESIDSILSQTFKEFEFIIVNEDPDKEVQELLNRYSQIDDRIIVLHQERHGLVASLNKGCYLARGKYIARMDADDISMPTRLEKQVAFMESHPDIGVCGTWTKIIGNQSGDIWRHPLNDKRIRCEMLFNSPFAHPSIMMHRDLLMLLDLPYNPQFLHAEDYELWIRLLSYTNFANLSEVLLYHRLHSNNISSLFSSEQESAADRIRKIQLLQLGLTPSLEELRIHHLISSWNFQSNEEFVKKSEIWLRKIERSNKIICFYPEPEFSEALAERWLAICSNASSLGHWTWKTYWNSPLSKMWKLSSRQKIMFALKCGMKYART
jgi:glycosyltransferase involved in cell wall biosynthesis